MGLSPWLSPYMLWQLKTGRAVQPVTFPMKRGTFLEPHARRAYEAETGLVMQPAVMVDGAYSASLDGITLAGDLTVEIKVPMTGRESETWKVAQAGQVPEHYQPQIQHQLMVSGADVGHFWVYGDGEGVLVEVAPDKAVQDALIKAWERFWAFVDDDRPPPLIGLDTRLRDDLDWAEAAARYLAAKGGLEAATAEVELARKGLIGLTEHSKEGGCGVFVTQYFKAGGSKSEYRISTRPEGAQ